MKRQGRNSNPGLSDSKSLVFSLHQATSSLDGIYYKRPWRSSSSGSPRLCASQQQFLREEKEVRRFWRKLV